uniref:Uncharacterized protein n=1 Tax=Anguilla anguilla TaxID=7936 RepID=A0A0E9QNM2_ANGAN
MQGGDVVGYIESRRHGSGQTARIFRFHLCMSHISPELQQGEM